MRHSSVQPARPCRKRLQASQNGDSRVVVKLFVSSAETIARKQASHKRIRGSRDASLGSCGKRLQPRCFFYMVRQEHRG